MAQIVSGEKSDITVNLEEVNCVCIIMELGEADLKYVLQSVPETSISESNVIIILYNCLLALNFIHSANIIHRDLKPHNLLIDSQSQVTICDFGMARAQPSLTKTNRQIRELRKKEYEPVAAAETHAEHSSRVKNFKENTMAVLKQTRASRKHSDRELTPTVISRWYRPPEVILCHNHYDKAVDIWSIGCILGELISCTTPYVKQKGYELNNRVLFKGGSCYPISPLSKNFEVDESD